MLITIVRSKGRLRRSVPDVVSLESRVPTVPSACISGFSTSNSGSVKGARVGTGGRDKIHLSL